MTGDMADENWGTRRVAQRNRRRAIIVAATIAVSFAFGIGGQYVAPAGPEADRASLIWASGLLAAAAILIGFVWREIDELQRRRLVNAAAVAGVTCIALLVLAQAAGRMVPVAEPMIDVMMIGALAMVATIVFQRVRG
jgi:hypothetical protein